MALVDVHAELPDLIRPLLREEYDRLVDLGVFDDQKIELLEGVLVEMSPEGGEHSWVIGLVIRTLIRELPDELMVRPGNPFAASDLSEPEPDVAVVPAANYRHGHPNAAVLLIEVSYSSRRKDLGVKARIYAAAGVPEYWVFDLVERVVRRHADPTSEGYATVTVHGPSERLDACGVNIDLGPLFEDR